MNNIILMADGYKYSHPKQYPENIDYMMSYFESRGGEINDITPNNVKFFGLQYYIKRYFQVQITGEMVEEAQDILLAMGLPFDKAGWMRVVNKHNGYIPLKIRGVSECEIVPRKNVLFTIESTDPELYWLVGWAETLLMKVWYPTTVATLSYNIKQLIQKFMEETSNNLDKLPFMLHDFGYRGASSEESASIGGMGHLTNFLGTDTIGAVIYAAEYYSTPNAGFSIPASEHSTITCYGRNGEKEAFENMINKFSNEYKLFACVSDSYDFIKALDIWGDLSEKIKEKNCTIVIRPDSGDAKKNILTALQKLEKSFGYTINTKGYKVLNNVALIQGDGVNTPLIFDILTMMKENNYSIDNIAFGMGGALLQGNESSSLNRDTHQFAIKCCAIRKNGEIFEIYKEPVTDWKKVSKKGVVDLIKEDGKYKTITRKEIKNYKDSKLITYYENGEVLCNFNLYGN